jgi:TRAP-type C4-dicarboxylate transport system substrate-binding protein
MRSKLIKKYFKIVSIILTLFLFFGISGCGNSKKDVNVEPTKDEKVFKLSLAHFQPSTHEVETVLIQGWIKEIEKATEGRVQITSYPSNTLIPGTEIFDGIVDGVADIGHSAYAYSRGRFPVIETLLVPGLYWENAKVADWTVMDFIEKLDPAELNDVKHLFSWTTGRGDLLTKEPIQRMEDISSLEIGVTAGERADALKRLGSTGIVLPMPDQYEAIQRGLTNGVIAPMETLKSFKLAEAVNYVTFTPMLYNQLLFMVMNIETWNSLPPDIQEIIENVNKKYYEEVIAGFYDRLSGELVYEWLEKEGIELVFNRLTEEESERWVEHIKPMFDDHIDYLNKRGLPGKEIFDSALELMGNNLEKYGK